MYSLFNFHTVYTINTNSDFLIGWFVLRDTVLWQNNPFDIIIVV